MPRTPQFKFVASRTETIIIVLISVVLGISVYGRIMRGKASCPDGFTKVIIYSTNELLCVRGDSAPVQWTSN